MLVAVVTSLGLGMILQRVDLEMLYILPIWQLRTANGYLMEQEFVIERLLVNDVIGSRR